MDTAVLKDWIAKSDNIVFFGGAGVSTESNIPDFRSEDGLYSQKYKHPPEQMLSHSFFLAHTEEFYEFYKEKLIYPGAQPNIAHKTLAALEKANKLKTVITQNIDGLHQAAGSQNVLELHGSVHRNYCMRCQKYYPLSFVLEAEGIPTCDCTGVVKPDVVLYEEGLDDTVMERAITALARADVLLVGGTSLAVYPAAGLIRYYRGKKLVLINKSATSFDANANLLISGSIGEALAQAWPQE